MNWMLLIVMLVHGGLNIETADFHTKEACTIAAQELRDMSHSIKSKYSIRVTCVKK